MTSTLDRAVNANLADMWAARLRARRYEKGLTQQQLGDLVGVGKSLIRNWECGLHMPSVPNLMTWAEVLGFEVQMVPADAARPDASWLFRVAAVLQRAHEEGSAVVSIEALRQALEMDQPNDKEK